MSNHFFIFYFYYPVIEDDIIEFSSLSYDISAQVKELRMKFFSYLTFTYMNRNHATL